MKFPEKVVLGRSQLKVVPLVYGCWAIGGHRWGSIPPEPEILRSIKEAVDLGIDLFDTAPAYGFGYSETLLGKALGKKTPWPFREAKIASKFGLVWDENKRIFHDASAKSVRPQVEASLKRLNRDSIDLLQLHWPDPMTPIGETLEALQRLQQEGLVREIGCSNFSLAELKATTDYGGFTTLQTPYSLLERQFEVELRDGCLEQHLGVLVYSPLAKGLLTGKYSGTLPRFGKNDIRARDLNFQPENYQALYPVLQRFQEIATDLNTSAAALALAWLLHQSGVDAVIAGIKHRHQLKDNLRALELKLSPATLLQLDQLFPINLTSPTNRAPTKNAAVTNENRL